MIKKYTAIILSFLVVFSLATGVALAQKRDRAMRIVTVPSDEVVNKSFYINAGDQVEISGTVNGDVVVAGGQILIDGVVNGDVLAAGGTINIAGEVTQDVRALGGQVNVTGQVGKNVTAVGANIDISSSSQIDGGVLVAGGNVSILGNVAGDAILATGNATIAGVIGGNIEAYLEQARLTSNSRVGGDFTYYSENNADIDKSASVSGQINKRQPIRGVTEGNMFEGGDLIGGFFDLQFKFFSFMVALMFAVLFARFMPNYLKTFYKQLDENKGRSIFYGFLIIVLTPVLFVLLLMTIIGIPFAMLFLFFYVLYLYLAKIFVSYWIGIKLLKNEKPSDRPYKIIVVGLLIYYLVTLIPIIDFFVSILTALAGVGAAFVACKKTYKIASEKKLV